MKSPFTNLNQLFEDLAATLRIRAFRLHLGMYLGGYISQDILNGVLSYIIAFMFLGSVADRVVAHDMDGGGAVVLGGRSTIWLALRIDAAPSYRIALGLFVSSIIGIASLYVLASRISPGISAWWSSRDSDAARSTTSHGASTTTCPTLMKSSPAGGVKGRSRGS